jgi:hypothetical protein
VCVCVCLCVCVCVCVSEVGVILDGSRAILDRNRVVLGIIWACMRVCGCLSVCECARASVLGRKVAWQYLLRSASDQRRHARDVLLGASHRYNLPVSSHGMQELHVSLLAAVPNQGWMEVHSFPIDEYVWPPSGSATCRVDVAN